MATEEFRRQIAARQIDKVRDIRLALRMAGFNDFDHPLIMNSLDDLESGLRMARIGIWR